MFYQKLFQKCCMEIHLKVKIDICTFYLYKIHLGLNKKKCIFIISVFMKKISLKEQNKKKFTQDTLFSKQYQRISEQLIYIDR
jgi:hypothetical protein